MHTADPFGKTRKINFNYATTKIWFVNNICRTCAWGHFKPEPEEEPEESQETPENPDEIENPFAPKEKKPAKEEYDFIVSGAIGNPETEVKVWRVEDDKFTHLHSLAGHSLGIVSVEVSPNGKCR